MGTNKDVPRCKDITDVIIKLRMASGDERELQIIYDTITFQAVALAWTIREGIIYYENSFYVLATSPLLQDILDSIGMTASHLLAIGFHSATSDPAWQAFPSSILLLETWPQHQLPAATIALFYDNDQIFITINDVCIDQYQPSGYPLVSPPYDMTGNTLFGTMHDRKYAL